MLPIVPFCPSRIIGPKVAPASLLTLITDSLVAFCKLFFHHDTNTLYLPMQQFQHFLTRHELYYRLILSPNVNPLSLLALTLPPSCLTCLSTCSIDIFTSYCHRSFRVNYIALLWMNITSRHYEYRSIFIRTKKDYIGIVDEKISELATDLSKDGLEGRKIIFSAIRSYSNRNNLKFNLHHFRKIFATYLRIKGIGQEIMDLLQKRIPQTVFLTLLSSSNEIWTH